MQPDGTNTKAITDATTKDKGKLKRVREKLWAILGLKMAIDRLRSLGYEVVASTTTDGLLTITIEFHALKVDVDSGMVNKRDILGAINKLDERMK